MKAALVVLVALVGFGSRLSAQDPAGTAGLEFYERRVRPLLSERCYDCHSAKAGKSKGGLRLDSRAALLKGGESGPALLPGDPEGSRLIAAVRYSESGLQMPPKQKLPATGIDDLVAWIKAGAPMPEGTAAGPSPLPASTPAPWAFRPIVRRVPPTVRRPAWVRTPIDCFILARLEEKGLTPAPDADRRTLIRRVSVDLTGLPPSSAEVDAFLADESPDAFAALVERLLASPHYGERWGRHWLDVVRYADTSGNSSDFPVPQAWRYRNYVIDSFNRDKPFARFVREQIAGDLLSHESEDERREHLVATGFLALARRFGGRRAEADHLTLEDVIDTMGRSLLGLSLSCARCHDHKFDPIPSEDYYALYGIFESTRFPFPGTEGDKKPDGLTPLVPPETVEKIVRPFRTELARLDAELKRLEKDRNSADYKDARRRRDDVAMREPSIDSAYAVAEDRPHDARLQIAGNPRNLGRTLPRRFLSALGGGTLAQPERESGRSELAGWLTDPRNPLTPRVAVNRIWQHHFGRGLVQTPNDFGNRGRLPTHPELLDYLASRFLETGGSFKAMHRLILLSRTYQMSARNAAVSPDLDPADDLLWKYPARRLDAESIRDAILAVSGDLDPSPGAGHPFPAPATWTFTQHHPFVATYENDRRSVYLMQQRNQRHPYFALFDGADPNASTPERTSTTTPLQALFFMNHPFVHQKADHFADRLLAAVSDDDRRIDLAFRLALGRPPTDLERRRSAEHLRAYSGGVPLKDSWASLARALFCSNEFVTIE
jgi:hypothetical protein